MDRPVQPPPLPPALGKHLPLDQPPLEAIPHELRDDPNGGKVPWRGRDLLFALLAGTALSAVFMIPIVMLMTAGDEDNLTFAAVGAMGIAIYSALCITGWYFAIKRRGATLRHARWRPASGKTMLTMIPVTIGMMILTGVVVSISSLIFGDVPTAQDQVVGGADSIALQDFVWLFVLGAIAAPIAEEFLFRGLLYPLLRNRLSVAVAVGISAFAFAFVHFIPPLIPALLVMGVVLALLVEHFKSLYPAILVHALNNAVALLALYATIGTG